MGWCVDCHRGKTPLSPAEEKSVQEHSSFIRQIKELRESGSDLGGFEGAYPKQRASTDCVACHY
jgi:hypothetical protein